MTRFKEYARSKGVSLACDYDVLPRPESTLEEVIAAPEIAAVLEYHRGYGWIMIDFTRSGRTRITDPTREEIVAAINRGRAWWDCVDPEEVQL